jgi:tRNA (cmo5U34)-methyltransferase
MDDAKLAPAKAAIDGATRAAAAKFDTTRAGEYGTQSRVALAGYDACHELAACALAACLGAGGTAHVLVAGAGGTAQEIVTMGALEPAWRFTAVDPSAPMLALSRARVDGTPLAARTVFHEGVVDDLPAGAAFDAATLIGVLHHLPGDDAKQGVLRALAARLPPGAPLVVACNYRRYATEPVLLATWAERWRMHGATPGEVDARMGKILEGVDPPASEDAVAALLADAGFGPPTRFFASLFWGAWIARRA